MTKVSRRFLNKYLEERIFEVFVKTIADLKDKKDIENFLDDLLSPTEKIMLVKRLAIAVLLAKHYTYDEIDETLKVSRATIMKISYWLRYGKTGYQKVVDNILKTQKREEMLDKVEEILIKLSPPKRFGSIEFEKKQKAGKDPFKRKSKRNLL